jgi:HNH endonuclease
MPQALIIAMKRIPLPEPIRFLSNKLHLGGIGDCWVWEGTDNGQGYGVVGWKGKQWRVHRLIYTHLIGPIDRQHLDHLCRNRKCANPEHLEPVTNTVNVLRGEGITANNARATHCKRAHPLTELGRIRKDRKGRDCRQCNTQRMRVVRSAIRARGPQVGQLDNTWLCQAPFPCPCPMCQGPQEGTA